MDRTEEPKTELARARAAFDAGDYRRVRRLCADLVESEDEETRAEAAELRRRVSVDSVQVAVLGACLAFFLVIVYVYVLS